MMISLSSLPVEILHRIAGFLPCSSILNLTNVNRKLNKACYDRLVFKENAMHSVFLSGLDTRLEKIYPRDRSMLWWADGYEFLKDATLLETIQTAHAVERLLIAAGTEGNQWKSNTPRELSSWLPHLLALRHPACPLLQVEPLMRIYYSLCKNMIPPTTSNDSDEEMITGDGKVLGQQDVVFMHTSFALMHVCMTQMGNRFLYSGISNPQVSDIMEYFGEACYTNDLDYHSHPLQLKRFAHELEELEPEFGQYTRCITFQQAYTHILPLFLRIMTRPSSRPDQFPFPDHMAFCSFMDIPRVYRDPTLFSTCHIAKMTTPEELSGTWMGHYSDHQLGIRDIVMDPEMSGIIMRTRPPGEHDRPSPHITAIIDRSTTGVDAHGPFILYGEVTDDGQVHFAKMYTRHGTTWMYRGVVTPFGILGAWGNFGSEFGGYFWIWNKDWR